MSQDMTSQIVCLLGGKGTRLESILKGLPKPLVDVLGKPLLLYQVELGKRFGIKNFLFLTHYGSEKIKEFFGSGEKWGVHIEYHQEETPLGTAGAVLDAWEKLADRFLVFYGDMFIEVDLHKFEAFHQKHKSDISLYLHPNDHPHDSDLVEITSSNRVTGISGYPHPPGKDFANLANAPLYIVEKRALSPFRNRPFEKPFDFGKNLFPQALKEGVSFYGFQGVETIQDIGTPERYESFVVALREKKTISSKRKAVFLDRDGTLISHIDRVTDPDQVSLLEGAGKSLREINQSGYLSVLVTNQPVIAWGDCTEEGLTKIHHRLEMLLGAERSYLSRIYFCPHDETAACSCRKPGPEMLLRAASELGIDLSESWMVGDTTTDIQTAKRAGVRSVLVRTGLAGRDGNYRVYPDYEFQSLTETSDFIVNGVHELENWLEGSCAAIGKGNVVAIGGPSQSGKTTLASTFKYFLESKGIQAEVIRLDSWILPPAQRLGSKSLRGFPLEAIDRSLAQILSRKKGSIPYYDQFSQRSFNDELSIEASPEKVLIVEGVVALLIPSLVIAATLKIYAEAKEELRKKRFERHYQWRGLGEGEIKRLYEQWEKGEVSEILQTKPVADLEWEIAARP